MVGSGGGTICSMLSGSGLWSVFASPRGARFQTSIPSCVVRMTAIAFSWIGATTAFGRVVKIP